MRVVDTRRPILEVAKTLMKNLQRRSGTLEQSKIRDVSKWAGLEGKPLCNVYVNVLNTGFNLDGNSVKEHVFEPVKVSLGWSEGEDLGLTNVPASVSRLGVGQREQRPVE